jgi:hypothetical protein
VQNIVKKANQVLHLLRNIASSFQINRRRTLVLQYVLSIIDYSLLTIYPYLSPQITKNSTQLSPTREIYTTNSPIRLNPLCHSVIPPAKHPWWSNLPCHNTSSPPHQSL